MRRAVVPLLLGVALWSCSAPPVSHQLDQAAVGSLELVDMAQRRHAVSEDLESGKKVVLVFWETWCESCREESGELARAANAHPELAFYGVIPGPDGAVDDAVVLETARRWHLPYPQVRDRDLLLTRTFGVAGTPTIVVVGAGGEVVYFDHEPPADWAAL